MWITHSYIGTNRNGAGYLFFLLFKDYLDEEKTFAGAVGMELERFARNMQNYSAVVRPFRGDVESTHKQVLHKSWSCNEKKIIIDTPLLLIIDQDFDNFDPVRHRWRSIKLSSESGEAAKLRSLLDKITSALGENDDIFALIDKAVRASDASAVYDAVTLRPGFMGVSVDLRSAWKSMKTYLRNHAKSRSTNDIL